MRHMMQLLPPCMWLKISTILLSQTWGAGFPQRPYYLPSLNDRKVLTIQLQVSSTFHDEDCLSITRLHPVPYEE